MYIALPHELYDAYNDGEITDSMYEVMVWLHYRANWETGKVKKVCSENIHRQTNARYTERTYRDALKNLEDCGWITRHRKAGQHGTYWVTIHNFVALTGAKKEQVLNPKDIKPYANAEPPECREKRHDGAVAGAMTVPGGCHDGATIQIYRDSEPIEISETQDGWVGPRAAAEVASQDEYASVNGFDEEEA